MFSSSVIWAIHVLSELDDFERTCAASASGDRLNRGLILTTDNKMQKSILRSVLRKLVTVGYIENRFAYNAYRLRRDISDISIFQLVQLFHGGVCIGEPFDHSQTVGKEMFRTGEYGKLLLFENKQRQSIEKQLLTMHIGELQK